MEARSNNELDEAYNLVLAEKYPEGIKLAEKYYQDADQGLVLMAYTIAAIAYFRDQKYEEAKGFYKKCADMSNDNQDWFNVCTSATLAKDIALGKLAYEKAISALTNQTNDLTYQQVTYYYSQALADAGEFEKSREMAYKLKPFFIQSFITDPHYLFSNGMPVLYDLLDVLRKVYAGTKDTSILEWLDDLASKVDEEGKEEIKKFKGELDR
jgi:tetratricopeptide (TPR) repeat protein